MYRDNDEPKQQPGMQQIVRIEDDLSSGTRKMSRQIWVESKDRLSANRDHSRFLERFFQLPDSGLVILSDGLIWVTTSGMIIQACIWGLYRGWMIGITPMSVVLFMLVLIAAITCLFIAAERVLPSPSILFYRTILIIVGLLLGAF